MTEEINKEKNTVKKTYYLETEKRADNSVVYKVYCKWFFGWFKVYFSYYEGRSILIFNSRSDAMQKIQKDFDNFLHRKIVHKSTEIIVMEQKID